MAEGRGLTVSVVVTLHPPVVVYVTDVVPVDAGVTMPLTKPIVATEALPLDHVPPESRLPKVPVAPRQICKGPMMA